MALTPLYLKIATFEGLCIYKNTQGKKTALFQTLTYLMLVFFIPTAWSAPADGKTKSDMQGISIIGDKESPTVLNLVPWKSPKNPNMIPIEIPDIDALTPVQRKTLRREINYFYQHQAISQESVKNTSP